jgi:plasmid stabilization system protein ParE
VIAAHPKAGRPAEGMEAGFRERWIAFGGTGYLVLYRLDGQVPVILAVRHGRELGF